MPDRTGSGDATVRAATPDDQAALRDIYRRSSLSNEDDREALLDAPGYLEWQGDGIASGGTRVAVDADARILGFATFEPHGVGLELEDLFVDPDFMRRGVATRLMTAIVDEAARAGAPWIEVTGNPHAAEFYASVGFVGVGRAQTTFGPAPRLRLELRRSAQGRSTPTESGDALLGTVSLHRPCPRRSCGRASCRPPP